jgi:phage terminase large subunit-like protein
LKKCYLPEQAIKDSKNASYEAWAHEGHIIKTPGESISNERIQNDIEEWSKLFRIRAAHYDPWNAAEMAERMSKKHINMVEFKMTTSNLSEPMKKLDAEIREGHFLHDGDPVTRWNMGNVVAKLDSNGNVFPKKQAEKHKIDISVAIIMAMAGWASEKSDSVYEKRGIVFV